MKLVGYKKCWNISTSTSYQIWNSNISLRFLQQANQHLMILLIIIIETLISDLNNDRNPTLKQTSCDKTPPKQINHAMDVFSPSQNGVICKQVTLRISQQYKNLELSEIQTILQKG